MKKIKYTCLFFANSFMVGLHAQHVLKIQNGTVFSTTGSVVVTLKDMDFDNDGIFNQTSGRSIFVFNGKTDNTISGNSSPLFDILELSKTGNAQLTLQQDVRIATNIQFNGGNLELDGRVIDLFPTASLVNESESSHITGVKGGYVQIINTLNAPSAIQPGNLGAAISSTRDLGRVVIRRGHQSQTNAYGAGTTILRYFDIMPANNTALDARLRFHYLDAELNGLSKKLLTLLTSADNKQWTNLGVASSNANYVEQAGMDSFNRYTLTEPNNALPLVWGSFNTQCISGQTTINWNTVQEQNTLVFVIRRSTNGVDWTNIGSIPAAGNSQTSRSYSYTDAQPVGGTTFYQLYQEDLDGRHSYSPVFTSKCAQPDHIKVYPVPVQNNCWVSIQSERSQPVSMRLYNVRGALMKQQAVSVMRGNNVFELSLANYPPGVYSLMFTWSDGKVEVIKVEKN